MDKDELINGYFEGSLSESQLEEFNSLLEKDVAFTSEFEFQKELQDSLKKQERQEIKELFSNLKDENGKTETKVIKLRPWLAAASIALLAGLAWWFLFNTGEINTEELYAANFAPYDNVIQPIERGDQLEDLKTKAFTAYENEEYPKALELFKELQGKHNEAYIEFYKAMVLMQLNKQEEAIPLLEGYIEKGGELKDRASWYLALAYLKLNRLEDCKEQLNLRISSGTYKTAAAKKLLSQLE